MLGAENNVFYLNIFSLLGHCRVAECGVTTPVTPLPSHPTPPDTSRPAVAPTRNSRVIGLLVNNELELQTPQ